MIQIGFEKKVSVWHHKGSELFDDLLYSQDKWISHQDDFNELLAELNNQHGQNNNNTGLFYYFTAFIRRCNRLYSTMKVKQICFLF